MRILVIDDSKLHLKAAVQTLEQNHELTTCSSYDEAIKLLDRQRDYEKRDRLCAEYEAQGLERRAALEKANAESREPYWDVVLCDLLMPAGKTSQGDEGLKYVGQEMPVGWALALKAAQNGAQYVAVVTDTDHHSHPASALLDFQYTGTILQINEAKALFINSPGFVGIKGSEYPCAKDFWQRGLGTMSAGVAFREIGKDWENVLNSLLAGKK